MTKKDDLAICVHESGHALMSYFWRRGPVSMELFGQDSNIHGISYSRTAFYRSEINPRKPEDVSLLQKCLLVGVAGPAAEFLYRGEIEGCEDDHEFVLEQLRFIQPETILDDLTPYVNAAQRILAVPQNWGRIMDLAEALRKKRKLTGDQAKEVIRNSRQPAKPPFEPVDIKLEMIL